MRRQVAQRLVRLNQEFYQTFAAEFAASRASLQPGIRRVLAALGDCESILDLGCGDGRVAQALAGLGWAGEYVGVDLSAAMLERARARDLRPIRAVFAQADLADRAWAACLSRRGFDAVLMFAVLHHLPGARRRARLVRQMAGLLGPGGRAAISTWQFLGNERLRRKIAPWSRIGLDEADVGPADYLLDWKRGGEGLRYACALGEAEVRRLAEAAGLRVEGAYRADGQTGELSLYVVARRPVRLPKS
jgi:SAM-dependent methyltransferase